MTQTIILVQNTHWFGAVSQRYTPPNTRIGFHHGRGVAL